MHPNTHAPVASAASDSPTGKNSLQHGCEVSAQTPRDSAALRRSEQHLVQLAVWRHDVFNLLALGMLNLMNIRYLYVRSGFGWYWAASMVYFVVDFLWILLDQACVKSAPTLAVHHVVSAVYAFLPFFYPEVAIKMSLVMTVEVNTWFLTARRVFPSLVVEALFYFTWFVLRVAVPPYLVWDFYKAYAAAAARSGTPWHPILVAPVLQVALCAFYAKWTTDLLKKLGSKKSHQL